MGKIANWFSLTIKGLFLGKRIRKFFHMEMHTQFLKIGDRVLLPPNPGDYVRNVLYIDEIILVLFWGKGSMPMESNVQAFDRNGEFLWEVEALKYYLSSNKVDCFISVGYDEELDRICLGTFGECCVVIEDEQTGKVRAFGRGQKVEL